jgi:peptide/nickel transport system ATP-binding protein
MTEPVAPDATTPGAAAPGTAANGLGTAAAQVPLLEARDLTKHFAVHKKRAGRTQARRSRRGPGDHDAGEQQPGNPPARGRRGRAMVHAVEQVSVSLPAGGITAVVGESGSGKSTLARMLARLIAPTSGQVLLDGHVVPASARGRRDYARDVQLVLQDPFSSLNPIHDVRYHLSRPLLVHHLARRGPELEQAIGGLLERVALTPPGQFLDKYPHELSGGQRQRVAIARALAVRPRVLLADEPVSMLDVSIRLGVLNLLADLRAHDQLSILYITHDIASARYLADSIMVMYAGQVAESGPAATITDQPAHPYTTLLLSAAPDPDRAGPPALAGRGAPPSLVTPPAGCRFHPRCPHAMAVCAQRTPPAFEAAAAHPVPALGHDQSRPRHPVPVRSHEPTLALGADPSRPRHRSACWLHATGLSAAESQPLAGRAGGLVPSPPAPAHGKEP